VDWGEPNNFQNNENCEGLSRYMAGGKGGMMIIVAIYILTIVKEK
jgi:hypothetical protein